MKRLIRSMFLGCLFAVFLTPAFGAEVVIPDAALKAAIWQTLGKPQLVGILTPEDMLTLTELFAGSIGLTSLKGLEAAPNLSRLDLPDNRQPTDLVLPAGLSKLTTLNLYSSLFTSLTLPGDLTSLYFIVLDFNPLTSLTLPTGLGNLSYLSLRGCHQMTNLTFSPGLTNLTQLDLSCSTAAQFTLNGDLSHLTSIVAGGVNSPGCGPPYHTSLNSLTLGEGLTSLTQLVLYANPLTNLTLSAGLRSLSELSVVVSELTSLTLPAGLTNLTKLHLEGNARLKTLTLPRIMAETTLQSVVAQLKRQGVSVEFSLELSAGHVTADGLFEFLLSGSPGQYQIQVTPDFSTWTELKPITIPPSGSVQVTDPSANKRPRGYYRAVLSN